MAERARDPPESSSPPFPPSIKGKEKLPDTKFDLNLSPPHDGDAELKEQSEDDDESNVPNLPSSKGKEKLPITTFDLNLSPLLDGDAELKEQIEDGDESNVPNLPSSSSHQIAVSQEPVCGLAKNFTGEVADDTRKRFRFFRVPMTPNESSPREARNVMEKDLQFQDQEMAKKTAHGVGFLGPEHSSETPLSLDSLGAVVREAELKDEYESNVTNLGSYISHQTTVSKQGVRGLGKEIDGGVSSDTSNEFRFPIKLPDSPKQEAGSGCQENVDIQDQGSLKKRACAAGFQDSSELANTRALSPIPNEKKEDFIRKVLTESDVNSDSRLWMTAKEVLKLLPVMNLSADKICKSDEGVTVKIFDTQSKKESTLALRTRFGQYFFCKGWKKKFVNERGLKQGDEIELAWDAGAGILNFSVINRARVLSPRPNRKEDAFIRKVLNNSHVDYHSELSLGKKEVLQILPHINLNALRPGQSEKVKMLDTHSGEERTMTLRQQSGSRFTLTNLWKKKFVDEHDLKKGDEIKLAWNERTRTLTFSIIGRAVPRGQSSRTA